LGPQFTDILIKDGIEVDYTIGLVGYYVYYSTEQFLQLLIANCVKNKLTNCSRNLTLCDPVLVLTMNKVGQDIFSEKS